MGDDISQLRSQFTRTKKHEFLLVVAVAVLFCFVLFCFLFWIDEELVHYVN